MYNYLNAKDLYSIWNMTFCCELFRMYLCLNVCAKECKRGYHYSIVSSKPGMKVCMCFVPFPHRCDIIKDDMF